MQKNKILSMLLLCFALGACGSNSQKSSTSSLASVTSKVSSKVESSKKDDTLSSTNTSSSSEASSDKVSEESQYVATDRVEVTLNVSLPAPIGNDVYVVGDFNNWGKFNTLLDEAYKVNFVGLTGSLKLSNVDKDQTYEYRYVQKINDATYTYDFASSNVDSNGNQVVGYTSNGKLISVFALDELGDNHSLTASEGLQTNDVISGFKDLVLGGDYQEVTPSVPEIGYHLLINDERYVELSPLGSQDYQGREQFVAYKVNLNAGDVIKLYNADTSTSWSTTPLEEYGAASKFEYDPEVGITCKESGAYDVYAKFKYNDDTIYIGDAA